MKTQPIATKTAEMIPHARGPYVSRIVPTGSATTFVETAAIVNIKLSLADHWLVNVRYPWVA